MRTPVQQEIGSSLCEQKIFPILTPHTDAHHFTRRIKRKLFNWLIRKLFFENARFGRCDEQGCFCRLAIRRKGVLSACRGIEQGIVAKNSDIKEHS